MVQEERLRTNTGIENHYCHIWLHSFANLDHFLEQLRLLLMSSGCIHNNNIKALFLELRYTLRSDRDRVRLGVGSEICDLGFRRRLSCLVKSTSAERISADNTRLESSSLIVNR